MSEVVNALKVKQWLPSWDEVRFDATEKRRKPEPTFYLFNMAAKDFMLLADVYRRRAEGSRADETGIQRKSASDRVSEISKFISGGYPWSDITEKQRVQPQFQDLRMPGWLPTAIVANILPVGAERRGYALKSQDSITVAENEETGFTQICLPKNFRDAAWAPGIKPLEVIDGQHRLLAFQEGEIPADFEIPVVAFNDLDVTWQAYLFYTINIKPKRINTSLAFDLYPLLRVQEWLEKSSNAPTVYRETRSQELTELLWLHPSSIWHNRISMLGTDKRTVSQAAFIRALVNTYVKRWDNKITGGLFASELETNRHEVLSWNRSQQAAFLIKIWSSFAEAVSKSQEPWATHLRDVATQQPTLPFDDTPNDDPAFWGTFSVISSDQGVRSFLQISNDIFYFLSYELQLADWELANLSDGDSINVDGVSEALASLEDQPVIVHIKQLCQDLARFDWRSPVTPGLTSEENFRQQGFRGSGGYSELRRRLALLLSHSTSQEISVAAGELNHRLS